MPSCSFGMPGCNNGCATSKSFARERRGVALRCAGSPLADRRGATPRGVVGAEEERCAERVGTAGASLERRVSWEVETIGFTNKSGPNVIYWG